MDKKAIKIKFNKDMTKRILLTCIVTLIYCSIWMLLEIVLYGQIEPRIVDDIMMLLFIPCIWKASMK